jgi:hypothetical protein
MTELALLNMLLSYYYAYINYENEYDGTTDRRFRKVAKWCRQPGVTNEAQIRGLAPMSKGYSIRPCTLDEVGGSLSTSSTGSSWQTKRTKNISDLPCCVSPCVCQKESMLLKWVCTPVSSSTSRTAASSKDSPSSVKPEEVSIAGY